MIKPTDPTELKFEKFLKRSHFVVRREWRILINAMMYRTKPTDKFERGWDEIVWWVKLVVIFFALKGFTYWMTGR